MAKYRVVYVGLVQGPIPGEKLHGWAVKDELSRFVGHMHRTEAEAKIEADRLNGALEQKTA
jgi:hypothetical protein